MPGDRREQVFVSSTYLDLRDERQSVIQALLIAGCIPAGMELFPAGNDEKWRLIQRVIRECDYYVLVIGGKYGSVDPTTELSYTEMEFDYAESLGKPIMAFLHGEPGKLTGEQIELDKERRDKLDAFRAKVEAARVVKYWNTPAELPGHVALALMETREHYPAEGWVRASQAMTPEQKTEIAELRARVAELTRETDLRTTARAVIADDLAQGDDEYAFKFTVTGYSIEDLDEDGDAPWNAQKYTWTITEFTTWNALLERVGPALLHEASEPEMSKALEDYASLLWRTKRTVLAPESFGKLWSGPSLAPEVVTDVVVQFYALGVIERGVKKRTVSDKGKYWALTELGQDQMMKLRAKRRA
ncbi:DUF4062 domain-containing protein [Planctomonas sp. JC2975]|uniref:DUF4062 domain-containing protein n=1 Tax=Planctomonas sp. JC2975 TaxID=2729626 RepID=UPI001474FE44|nr:DUF4062 domain-containing protein [Planctomonas sp. JC2975]NNC12850.1 DUF4062 domain-containing protein [Planctomonas sp. JC2975]